jgi:glycosyltransferase involved in cell wall biosynthesis
MKFSIATPTKNNLNKLKRCIGSLRGQIGIEFEHLIQDACSKDGTPQWLAKQKGLRWVSEHDAGMYDAINRAWARADGDILSWLNSDEQYLPGALSSVADIFSKHPDADAVYGDALVVRVNGELIAARREIRLSPTYIANSFLNAFSCTTFFRSHLWKEGILKLDSNFKYAADMDLVLRLLAAGKQIVKVPIYLGVFTLDGSNLSCHPQMLEETEKIQQRFGGCSSRAMRRLIQTGRHIERLLTGSYRKVNITYRFAVDEIPHYRTIKGSRVPGSYSTR